MPLLRGWQRRARVAERTIDIASDGFIVAGADGRLLQGWDGLALPSQLADKILAAFGQFRE